MRTDEQIHAGINRVYTAMSRAKDIRYVIRLLPVLDALKWAAGASATDEDLQVLLPGNRPSTPSVKTAGSEGQTPAVTESLDEASGQGDSKIPS